MATVKEKIDKYLNEKIIDDRLEDIVGERFGRYSKYIIQDRALPDVRDGLKPVQRRILYAMEKMGMHSNKPYKKSARIAGEVMGKYHPHGDSSIYEAMVRMSQYWKMSIPLIDMHGNNGSVDGDSAAAMRYTEARMSKASELLLENINKRTVSFVPNFDDEELEPVVLPARFPNILVNGAVGISAGYATDIPPHNLKEVTEAVIARINNPDLTVDEVMEIVKGPDFPTGGIVQGIEGIKQAYETGRGRIIVRAKTQIQDISRGQYKIIINEIPFDVNKANLVRSIDLIRLEKHIDGITEVRDESDRDGLQIAIELKKGANPEFVLNYLFKKTALQKSFNFNMVAICNRRPVLMSIITILDEYINHQKEVITNRSNYELSVAQKRLHIVDGLVKMVSILDDVIRVIRKSHNKREAKENIISAFKFSDEQAEAIVTLQLYRLSSTDVMELKKEKQELKENINVLEAMLLNEKKLLTVIKKELTEVMKLSPDRRTKMEEEIETIKITEEELVVDEQVMIAVTKEGYIKRSSIRSYSSSKTCGMKDNDSLIFREEVSTLNTLLIFTNYGHYIYMPVYKLDEQKWKDIGTYLNNLVTIDAKEKIVQVYNIKDFNEDLTLLFITHRGSIKQSKLIDYDVTRYSKAMKAMKISQGDTLASVDMAANYPLIVVFTSKGKVLRFKSSEISIVGSAAGGVKSMNTTNQISGAIYTRNNHDIVFLTSRGNVKRIKTIDLPLSKRANAGIRLIKELKANPHLLTSACTMSYAQYREDVEVMIATGKGNFLTTSFNIKYVLPSAGQPIVPAKLGKSLRIDISKLDESEIFDIDTEEAEEVMDEDELQQLSLFDDDEKDGD